MTPLILHILQGYRSVGGTDRVVWMFVHCLTLQWVMIMMSRKTWHREDRGTFDLQVWGAGCSQRYISEMFGVTISYTKFTYAKVSCQVQAHFIMKNAFHNTFQTSYIVIWGKTLQIPVCKPSTIICIDLIPLIFSRGMDHTHILI
jgi:hypothetical protein